MLKQSAQVADTFHTDTYTVQMGGRTAYEERNIAHRAKQPGHMLNDPFGQLPEALKYLPNLVSATNEPIRLHYFYLLILQFLPANSDLQ